MGLTVLIADDETMPRMVLREHLPWAELGVTEIVEASDGDETVERARACRPDILISDVKMPRKTGLEAAEWVRGVTERLEPAAVVVVDGLASRGPSAPSVPGARWCSSAGTRTRST